MAGPVFMKRSVLDSERRIQLQGIGFVLLAVLLWATVAPGTRLLVRGEGAFSVGFLSAVRLTIAAFFFVFIRLLHHGPSGFTFRFPPRLYVWLVVAALGIFLNYWLYGIGLRDTTAGATSVISQFQGMVTVLLAALLLAEPLTPYKVAGMIVATAGVVLTMFHGHAFGGIPAAQQLRGDLIEVAAAVSWPFYVIGVTKLQHVVHDREVLAPVFLLAALLMALTIPFSGPSINGTPGLIDWLVLLFLGVGSTAVAYWFFALAVERIQASEAAMFNLLGPPLSIAIAYVFLGEQIGHNAVYGVILVIVGLALIAWHRKPHHMVKRGRSSQRGIGQV